MQSTRFEFYNEMWRVAAEDVGAEIVAIHATTIDVKQGNNTVQVDRSNIGLDTAEINAQMSNKEISFQLMLERGYRIPKRQLFSIDNFHIAENFMRTYSGNVVVKPASGTGAGRGVTTGISSPEKLSKAARYASGFGGDILIEEELVGSSYRLLYLDGKFIDAVRRDSPVVVGDNDKNIRELIKIENSRRRSAPPFVALSPLTIDHDCFNTLDQQNLDLASRPTQGDTVQVKTAVNENAAEQNHVVRDFVHPEIVSSCQKLVNDLGVRFSGVDVTTDSIDKPMDQTELYFNEINVNPGIHHHFLVSDSSKVIPVASIVLEHLFGLKKLERN